MFGVILSACSRALSRILRFPQRLILSSPSFTMYLTFRLFRTPANVGTKVPKVEGPTNKRGDGPRPLHLPVRGKTGNLSIRYYYDPSSLPLCQPSAHVDSSSTSLPKILLTVFPVWPKSEEEKNTTIILASFFSPAL